MKKYKLIVIWDTKEKEEYFYKTEDEALKADARMELAFGNQIDWYGVVPVR